MLTFSIPGISTGWIPANPLVSRLHKKNKAMLIHQKYKMELSFETLDLQNYRNSENHLVTAAHIAN